MNYRTMIKGALALSLSLIVGSTWAGDVQQYGATFEQTPVGTVVNDFAYTEGDGITNAKYRVTQDVEYPYGWFAGSEEDESKIIAANGGKALQLNTDSATLTNKLAKAVADEINANGIAKAGAYFEMETKFVASDSPDAGIEGGKDATKFAIYAYCDEEANPCTTNLVVYHAYQDYEDESLSENNFIGYTNEVFATLIDTEVYTKLRIEMRQIDDNGTQRNLFSVSVNGGDPIASTEGLAYEDGIWFLTVENSLSDAAREVASLNFKGTGEIDNINVGVIEEAQPPDDTWTIEGFNAGGTWPLPTASTDTALFYSNLVVNIDAADSSIGRTINAAWIGAKIIAPEAVTAETVGNWKFDLNATQTGLSFDQCKDGEYFMYLWVPVTAAKVRAAIANQSDIVYTVSVYQEGDSANAQPLTLNICPKNITITNTDEVEGEGAETIEVSDWREQGVVEPTVITIALVNGATYTDAEGVLTFAAPEGYVVNSIYTNGVNTGSTTTFTTNGLTGTINIVAAAKKVRTPIGHKWFENPTVVGSLQHDIKTSSGYAPWHLGGDGDYVAGTSWTDGSKPNEHYGELKAFDINDIIAGSGSAIVSNRTEQNPTYGTWGAAVSMALNVALAGSNTGNNKAVAYPLNVYNGTVDVDTFIIENDIGIGFNDAAFTSDGQYLYANCYKVSGDNNRNYIYKFRVLNGLKSSGVNLEFVAKYDMGGRVRSIALGQFQGHDVVYAILNNTSTATPTTLKYVDTSAAEPTAAELISGYGLVGYFSDVVISGANTETPHITIMESNADNVHRLSVYTLTATGTALASADPVLDLDEQALRGLGLTGTAYCNSGFVTEDEETFIFEWSDNKFYAIQYVEPPAPTVISVAKLSATGAMVNDAAPTLTATVTDSDGETVDAADYTIDASAIDMTTAGLYPVIITATGAGYAGTLTNYYAVMNLTWFNGTPTQKAMLTNASVGLGGSLNEASHWMSKSEHGRFLAINHHGGNASTGRGVLSLYEIATLTNLYGACYSHWEFAQGSASEASKGVAVSEAAGLVIRGNVDYSPTAELTYAIDDVSNKEFGTELSYAFIKDGAPETRKHDGLAFSTDGNYFYVNTYDPSASQHIIGKYSVDKANNQFVWMQDYVGSVTRIRSVVLYQINGKDYVFYGEGGGSKTGNIYAMDTVTGESTLVCSALESSVFANDGSKEIMLVRISGIASGEMYLYAHSNKGTIVVWALRHDATSGAWKTALVREFTKAEYLALCDRESLSNSRNFEVSDDNQYGFILPHQTQDARLIIVSDISLAQRKALASATLMPAGSYQDVELGEITATVLDANGDTVAASEYTITTNAIDIATLGEYTVTITPVEGSVYSNAVTAVYTISEAAPAQKPAWAADSGDGSDQDPYWAWATAHAAGQDLYAEGADYSAQYLMNVDADKTPVLKIDSIQVGSGAAVIIVSATDGTDPISLATINGVLNVATGDTLTALTPKALGRAPTVSQDGKAMVVISAADGKFYRARVDFAAAETALTPVVISGGE